jgi:hypothetical protein
MNMLVQMVRQNTSLTSNMKRTPFDPLTELFVVNKTGAKLKPYYVVGLRNSKLDPTPESTNLEAVEFERVVIMEGHTPDIDEDRNDFGVILEGTEGTGEEIVRCLRTGIVQAYINMRDAEDRWVEVKDGDITQFNSSVTGMGKIMYVQDGTGSLKRGLVWLNSHHMGMRDDPLTDLSGGWDQEDQDSPRKEGVKFQIITVNDDYVAGANEAVKAVQYDSHGHLVLIEGQGESSSSQSSVSASSVSASSASSDSGAESLPSDSDPVLDCYACAQDYVLVSITLSECSAGDCAAMQAAIGSGVYRLKYTSTYTVPNPNRCLYDRVVGNYTIRLQVDSNGVVACSIFNNTVSNFPVSGSALLSRSVGTDPGCGGAMPSSRSFGGGGGGCDADCGATSSYQILSWA